MRKKALETNKHSTLENKPEKIEDWEEYLDLKTNSMAPANAQIAERFGIKFYLWCKENPEAYKMHQFCTLYGIGRSTLLRWKEKYSKFAHYYDEGMLILGDRREVGAMKKELDAGMIRGIMSKYDPDWKENDEWKAKLADGGEFGGTKIVIMEKFVEKE